MRKYYCVRDVCLNYSVMVKKFCTILRVCGSMLGKCQFVNLCVYELQVDRNITLYNDVCLRNILREMLFCTVMCV